MIRAYFRRAAGVGIALALFASAAQADPNRLGKGPLKVFILAGQSNMLGTGLNDHIPLAAADGSGPEFKRLVDANGRVIERKDVWIYHGGRKGNLTVGYGGRGNQIGPEFGFGWEMGELLKNQVLLIKTAWGGHSLKEKFLPPSAGGPGPSYTTMVKTVHDVLGNLKSHFPQYDGSGYEIVGFVWHQAWNDMIDRGQRGESPPYKTYTERQAQLIEDLRKEFKSPGMLMTIGECGVGGEGGGQASFRKAQEATALFPRLQKTVRFIPTAKYWDTDEKYRANQGYHYNGSGRTYYWKGVAFAKGMYDLMPKLTLADLPKVLDEHSRPAYTALKSRKYAAAYEALKTFEKVYQENVAKKTVDEKTLENQDTVLFILKREIEGPLGLAISEIESLRVSGDVYRLSLAFKSHHKAFKGIEPFDAAVGTLEKDLKSSKMRSAVSAGKRFYGYMEKVVKLDATLKGPRSPAHIKAITAYLTRFAKSAKDSVYAKAALLAAEKIADPKHAVTSASAYIQAVK